MVPGKLKKILWARTDRFDCGGRQFRGSGGLVKLKGQVSAAAVATAEAEAVAATVGVKPKTAKWLGQRALYTAHSPTRAALAAVAALYAAGFDPNTGLPAPSPIAPIEERKAPAMESATSHATTSGRDMDGLVHRALAAAERVNEGLAAAANTNTLHAELHA